MATAAQVEAFRDGLTALLRLARRDLLSVWNSLDYSDAHAVKAVLEDAFPDLVQTYGSTAALLAVDFYDELRGVAPSVARFRTVMAEDVNVEQAQAKARWAIGPLFGVADPAQALSNLTLGTDHLVKQFSRDTIARNAAKDPSRAMYARVPGGRDTCAFCLMLASRGAVYGSSSAAGEMNKYHGKCDCVPTPVWSTDDLPEGYDPDALYDQYASVHEAGMTAKETTAALRQAYDIK
jgi:hypothetical protein